MQGESPGRLRGLTGLTFFERIAERRAVREAQRWMQRLAQNDETSREEFARWLLVSQRHVRVFLELTTIRADMAAHYEAGASATRDENIEGCRLVLEAPAK